MNISFLDNANVFRSTEQDANLLTPQLMVVPINANIAHCWNALHANVMRWQQVVTTLTMSISAKSKYVGL